MGANAIDECHRFYPLVYLKQIVQT